MSASHWKLKTHGHSCSRDICKSRNDWMTPNSYRAVSKISKIWFSSVAYIQTPTHEVPLSTSQKYVDMKWVIHHPIRCPEFRALKRQRQWQACLCVLSHMSRECFSQWKKILNDLHFSSLGNIFPRWSKQTAQMAFILRTDVILYIGYKMNASAL